MREITIYEAEDGRQFDDAVECEEYEIRLEAEKTPLKVYGKHNKRIHDIWNNEAYNQSYKIVIPSTEALGMLDRLQKFYGFYSNIPINSDGLGTWKYNDKNDDWEKVS